MGEKVEKLQKYESTIREHVACEERAFRIVNNLIDASVQEDYLKQCGQLISRDHYRDVTQERAITFLCGYPLCENTLEKIPSKRYHISTKTNRVYDISERKNFCSNQCFKASKHFCNQIPESPLWSRERETVPELTLLSHKTIKGIVGDEIVGESPKKLLEVEVLQLEELDKRFSSSCQVSDASLARKKCTPSSVVGADCSKSSTAGADCSKSSTAGADCSKSSTAGADCSKSSTAGADCSKSSTAGADCSKSSTAGADCSKSSTAGADCRKSSTAGADCRKSSTAGADCSKSSTAGADCSKSSTAGADCRKSSTAGADCRKSSTAGADCSKSSTAGADCRKSSTAGADCRKSSTAGADCRKSSTAGADCSKSADYVRPIGGAEHSDQVADIQGEAGPNPTVLSGAVESCPGENAGVNLRVPETATKRDNCEDLTQGRSKVEQPCGSVSELCLPTTTCAATNVEGSKMDQLMKLLAQRKNLLSGMVDIQASVPSPSAGTLVNQRQQSGTLELAGSQLASPPQDSTHVHNPTTTTHTSTTTKPTHTSTTHRSSTHSSSTHTSTTTKSTLASAENLGPPRPPSSPVQLISQVIKSWVTQETLSYLRSLNDGGEPRGFNDPQVQLRYADLCRRLDMQQKTFENILNEPDDDDIKHKTGLKPPPDYQLLKQETEAFQLKVTEFITGKKPTTLLDKPELEDPVFIPPVDAYDQQQIRKKIVLERLDKAIPPLLAPLELSLIDVSTPVRELVHTFRLQNNNIVFKPSEWMIVSLFILKMLAKRIKPIASAFSKDSSTRFFSILLQGVGHTPADVDFMTELILNTDCATHLS
ncbi:putative RNA polymerase II subunit B1 CTD phosphatase RPAP2 isoform X2 [Physella acuta]|nr:putative RNA polymerase II subunit B1 CTD phosphatase RPAP2 isoform X2 [Physella acuta]XP_059151606.1 putative RNA polymerase II subunit B1 CTD phosphatase RPAP2 isoform X2 [Physella acuta]XP_059151607.1 putative RNA polymerase II subunit B1 CTD phosphatase RPAP2 isoform X2 [Physella acuta]XP_059151608.1 putative RNA polymerase II subunit B1 CTD phosphatase RPAP2 isoform X2 [Physella acuta]